MAELEVVHGDLWEAFNADPNTVVVHGVTLDKPAAAGFAGTVLDRLGDNQARAHFGVGLGHIHWLTPRIGAGVTQPDYHEADADLVSAVIVQAAQDAPSEATRLLVPLIGGDLGGLGRVIAMEAIAAGAARARLPVTLCLWP